MIIYFKMLLKRTRILIKQFTRMCLSSSPDPDSSSSVATAAAIRSVRNVLNKPMIGRTTSEQELLYLQQPDMPEKPRILKVSVLGVPNAGKSTLVNRLMNRRISSVSTKMNTTRNRLTAVLTDGDAQLIFLDTPGLISYKKQKKFNVDRQFIIDPHSSLWESDAVIIVHDVSDEYARNRIDKELIKCLFAHPEKESILVLNKTDKLKNKKVLLDLVVDLTGGLLSGKEFINRERAREQFLSHHALRAYDYDRLFARTAEKIGRLDLVESFSSKCREVAGLLDELRQCEEYLMRNLDRITIGSDSNKIFDVADTRRMSLQKLKDYFPPHVNPSKIPEGNKELGLIRSIVNSSPPFEHNDKTILPLRRIEDISPEGFKQDLMQTTDWHLYYKKINALSVLVREKTYWPYFNQVFMVSAKMDDGIDELKRYLFARARPGQWLFSRNLLTDQMPQDIAEMCVREKMLENLDGEVPYEMDIQVSDWQVDEEADCLNICINLIPGGAKGSYSRHISMLLKDSGKAIKLIREQAAQEIMNTFHCDVRLRLNITKKG